SGGVTVTVVETDVDSPPLPTVNVKPSVTAASPTTRVGAVKVADSVVVPASVTAGPLVCVHRYVSGFAGLFGSLAVPASTTGAAGQPEAERDRGVADEERRRSEAGARRCRAGQRHGWPADLQPLIRQRLWRIVRIGRRSGQRHGRGGGDRLRRARARGRGTG